jgi:hypothetical protein
MSDVQTNYAGLARLDNQEIRDAVLYALEIVRDADRKWA